MMLKRQSVWFILAGGIVATSDATAQVTSQVIVKTGDQVPGSASGEVFQSYQQPQGSSTIRVPALFSPVLDQFGRATFFGVTASGNTSTSVVRWSGAGLTTLFRPADAIDPDLSPPSLFTLGIRRGGSVLGTGIRPDGRRTIVAGSPWRYVVTTGDPITDRPQLGNWDVRFPAFETEWADVNSQGDVFFSGVGRNVLGLSTAGQTPRVVLAVGDVVGTETMTNLSRPAISSDGTLFARYQSTRSSGIVAGRPGAMRTLLPQGNLPGLPTGAIVISFDSFFNPLNRPPIVEHAEDGSVATRALVSTPDPEFGQYVVFAGSSEGMRAIWHSKKVIPGLPSGWTPQNNIVPEFVIAANDRVTALPAWFNDAAGLQRNVIAVGQGDALRAAVRGGDTVPGVPGATLGVLGLIGTNRWQDVLFSSLLVGPGIGVESDAVLMVATMDQGPLVLLREGQALTLSPGNVRTVLGFNESVQAVSNVRLNDLRQVLINVRFTDNTDALILFTVPAPSMSTLLAGLGLLAIRRRRAARS